MNNHTSSLEFSHFPVMLNEVLKITSPFNGGKYIDCTFGGGGYSKEILKIPKTEIAAIDRDNNIKSIAEELERKFPKRFKFYQIKFSQLDTIIEDHVDAIIFDLGLSSIQLDDYDRGFSFKSKKKLNMTMGLNEITALEAINNLGETDLKLIIKILGNEKKGGAYILGKAPRETIAKTVWKRASHDAGKWGSRTIRDLLGSVNFTYAKSPYAVLDCLRVVCSNNPDALILDFFGKYLCCQYLLP